MRGFTKRSISLLLVLCMSLALLSGCKGDKNDTPITPPNPDISNALAPAPDAPADTPMDTPEDLSTQPDGVVTPDPNYGPDSPAATQGTPDAPVPEPDTAIEPTVTGNDGDPWALTPAPSVEELLQTAFPAGKTIHASVMVNLSMELAIDPSALGEDVDMESMSAAIYMNAEMTQDSNAAYVEGTMTTYSFGENEVETQKIYTEKVDSTTMNSYTYNAESGQWIKSTETYEGSFGLESMMDFSGRGVDTTLFELEDAGTEYILTGTSNSNLMDVLGGAVGDTSDMEGGDSTTTTDMSTKFVIRIDKQTRQVTSMIATTEPFLLLFFNVKAMTVGLSNIRFDTADVFVPTDIKNNAVTIDSPDMSEIG